MCFVEEMEICLKLMVEIGGWLIFWYIMQYYSYFGFDDFVIVFGYKGEYIKKYFFDYYVLYSDF